MKNTLVAGHGPISRVVLRKKPSETRERCRAFTILFSHSWSDLIFPTFILVSWHYFTCFFSFYFNASLETVFGAGGCIFEGEGREGKELDETEGFVLLKYVNNVQSLISGWICCTFQRNFSLTGLPNAEKHLCFQVKQFHPLNLIILDQGEINTEGF